MRRKKLNWNHVRGFDREIYFYFMGEKKELDVEGIVRLWKLYESRGEYEMMIDCCLKGVAAGHVESMKRAGIYFRDKKRHSKAIEMYEMAVNLGDVASLSAIGQIYSEDLQNYEAALKWYLRRIDGKDGGSGKNVATAYWNSGQMYSKIENFSDAIEYVFKAFQLYSEDKDKKECLESIKAIIYIMPADKLVEHFLTNGKQANKIIELEAKIASLQTELDFRPGGEAEKSLAEHFYGIAAKTDSVGQK
ncbi:MAG: hypothetical protein Hyperionvirus2_185 [Hyperionvirus sp.]|uniref:Tetratricopeptide repeat protein n=1 Tax=Hyperionvirus sp. TaxID=2487770 RepID=A0A3G5A6E9_9VIRU|nr:MAG: hypothetical protein Hyperionvirus2_185 [Hyperionvirus sp.]